MTPVWFAIPTAVPSRCTVTFAQWQALGYKTAALVDGDTEAPGNADLVLRVEEYPGYGASVNLLCRQPEIASAEFLVTGGDDVLPAPDKRAEIIAQECIEHFGSTWGVMQPTGDDYWPHDCCGSPWMGREFRQRIQQGKGPMWEGTRHFYEDKILHYIAKRYDALWIRPDLLQYHQHWTRTTKVLPLHLRKAQDQRAAAKKKFLAYMAAGFPGMEPLPV